MVITFEMQYLTNSYVIHILQNSNSRLLIILPKEIEGLSQLEKKLQKLEFCKMLSNLSYSPVTLTLPKFGMEQLIDNMGTVLRKV